MLMHQPSTPVPMSRPVRAARAAMWLGLCAVAGAAAVVSFTALRDLGRLSAFGAGDWLLPVVIDAGAAVGSLVWLGRWAPDPARRFARFLAVTLLSASVAGNAAAHGMAAEHITPHWTVVVAVSAVAPAVLGAVVHLVVLVTDRDGPAAPSIGVSATPQTPAGTRPPDVPAGPVGDVPLRSVADLVATREARQRTAPTSPLATANRTANAAVGEPLENATGDVVERAKEMVAAGATRAILIEELGLGDYQARKIVEEIRPPSPRQKRRQKATSGGRQ